MSIASIILAAAKATGIPGVLLLAICTHESKLNNVVVQDDNGSPSYGVCQIKEETAKMVGFTDSEDLMQPKTNAKYAALYLKKQLDRYDGNWCKATAAYNAGSYNPSVIPGKPRNLKYIKSITLLLDEKHKDKLICGARKIASE
jgi:soluble lytic murein transglycosylase-like protein